MEKIIDIHCHIGDNLYPGGGKLIEKTGIPRQQGLDTLRLYEFLLYRPHKISKYIHKAFSEIFVKKFQERNFTGSRENLRRSMDEAGIAYSVCMPTSTYFVPFEDILKASEKDGGIIPFTGIDHTAEYDFNQLFASDFASGAKGLKMHPIIQKLSLSDSKSFQIVEAFAPYKLPVLFHCGVAYYYYGNEILKARPEFGNIKYAKKLVESFSGVNFIAGHSGSFNVTDAIDMLGGYNNVWFETSFLPPGVIKNILKKFGPERVVFGSDWPFGNMTPSIRSLKKACNNDKGFERRVFFENSAELLGISA